MTALSSSELWFGIASLDVDIEAKEEERNMTQSKRLSQPTIFIAEDADSEVKNASASAQLRLSRRICLVTSLAVGV